MAKQYIKTNSFGTFYYKDPEMTILHRKDGPAVEYYDGSKSWYLNGKRHRLDGPALEYTDSINLWYVNGENIFTVNKAGKIIARMR